MRAAALAWRRQWRPRPAVLWPPLDCAAAPASLETHLAAPDLDKTGIDVSSNNLCFYNCRSKKLSSPMATARQCASIASDAPGLSGPALHVVHGVMSASLQAAEAFRVLDNELLTFANMASRLSNCADACQTEWVNRFCSVFLLQPVARLCFHETGWRRRAGAALTGRQCGREAHAEGLVDAAEHRGQQPRSERRRLLWQHARQPAGLRLRRRLHLAIKPWQPARKAALHRRVEPIPARLQVRNSTNWLQRSVWQLRRVTTTTKQAPASKNMSAAPLQGFETRQLEGSVTALRSRLPGRDAVCRWPQTPFVPRRQERERECELHANSR